MRLTGWVLLVIGGLLCATISWAALGFLLMGIGLISLQVAERRRRPGDDAVPAGAGGFTPPRLSAGLQPPTLEPVSQGTGQDTGRDTGRDTGPQRQPRRVAWPDKNGDAPYDRQAWRRLVESDPDLAQLAKVLADYGPQYVDELAASYLAAPDKSRLGAIVDGIIAHARDGQPAPPPTPVEGSRPPPLPPRPEPEQVAAPAAKPAASPSNSADALEASLLATVEQASARIAAERAGLFKPARELGKEPGNATDSRPSPASQREPLFGRARRDAKPAEPPPVPTETPADLEASLIAAVSETAARRADTFKPEPEPTPPQREPEIRAVAPPKPVAPPPANTLPAKTPADNLDETLLAALAEISGQKFKDEPKPDAASKAPPGSPADDVLSDMIEKFAPDSSFLRKQ
ncbi:hypothetical protein HAP47_0004440 [Bradyrhizobium sp. 41S5]|uniref:hypothetical protein n=1 Tax=Bradyrhizobium sp. 41S5 TaxID=1404443 RepID=UPI00156B9811|nr:hypothetical protein [Bradyrhizobium sp. 41S5]UFX45971.1 hypothetical protein HAP47_0004440 [Bradyrhizobium sp. 41S5]